MDSHSDYIANAENLCPRRLGVCLLMYEFS